ncbi:hypothetical protein Fmac_011469 [Flemingia macrophylla]|uniref:Pentatricopeptide repeat-containing protein n=1 Tax=Flemingia macrophylla TaxID=520843 RepID=A0ABD1MNB5_9FABA
MSTAKCFSLTFPPTSLSTLTESFVYTHHPSFAFVVQGPMIKHDCGGVTYNTLMSAFCKGKRLVEARGLFEAMKFGPYRPNLVTYGVFIDCFCKSGEVGEGLVLLKEMEKEGLFLMGLGIFLSLVPFVGRVMLRRGGSSDAEIGTPSHYSSSLDNHSDCPRAPSRTLYQLRKPSAKAKASGGVGDVRPVVVKAFGACRPLSETTTQGDNRDLESESPDGT